MNRLLLLLTAIAVHLGSTTLFAEDAELTAIRQAVASYIEAFNRQDADAIAEHWSENGVYLDRTSGQRVSGRENLRKAFAAVFADEDREVITVQVESIRLLSETVAVEEGTARTSREGQPPSDTAYTAIHIKQDGRWLLDSIRETVLPPIASNYEHLKELEWMIGTWIDADEQSTVRTVCEWTKNRNFITRSFSVSIQDRIDLEGTQVIGWDAANQRIRSWMFDSDGGFGQADWARDGDRWIVTTQRTLPTGQRGTAVTVMTYVDDQTMRWKSVSREIDGELLPNIEEVTIKKVQN